MASYSLEINRTAEKQLKKLDATSKKRIALAIQSLAEDPFPHGYKKLQAFSSVYRVRVGTFRIVYSVESQKLKVLILKVGQRKDVYR